MFDNRKAPHVHNKSVMCNFIFIQSILLSHCELNTFFFFYKGCLIFLIIKGKLLGIKAASLSTSFASLQHVKKACDFWDAASWFEWILLCSKLESRHSFILNLVFVWMLVEIQGIGWSWFWEQPRAWWSVLGYKTIKPSSPCRSLSRCRVSVYKLFLHLSLPGSFTGSGSTEAGSITTTTTDSVDQVSPTMPRATKNRVSGKLRRSASAISKSSNWALQPVPLFPLPECRLQSFLEKPHKLSRDCKKLLWCFIFFPFLWHININWSIRQFLI